jgi:ribonuclease P protein component
MLVVYACPRDTAGACGCARLGLTVSKKVGGAVQRNQVKRWLREGFRRMPAVADKPVDVIVIAKPSAKTGGYQALQAELTSLLRRCGL